MPIDAQGVGANQRQIIINGDPNTAANMQSVLTVADATSLAGLYGSVTAAIGMSRNAAGTFDLNRSVPGIIGIPSVSTEGQKTTYAVGSLGITPAANPTDLWTLIGSGTKTVRLLRLAISGFATAAATIEVQLIRRSAANSGGTSSTPTLVSSDSNNAAATAVVSLYSVNPASLGSTVGNMRAAKLNLGAAGAAGSLIWDFGTRNGQGLVLRGIAQGLAINLVGAAMPSGASFAIDAEFVEDAS